MNPQISPFGIILALPFYGLALFVLYRLWRRQKASPWRWGLPLLVPMLLVMPFVDEYWIRWNFERACEEAGVKVYRKAEAEGFFNATGSPSSDMVEKLGFRFTEGLTLDGKGIAHEEKIDGKWHRTILAQPQARYHYRYADPRQWVPAGFQINRMEKQVVDSESGEVLGRDVKFERYPGFVEGLWIRYLGSGQTICPNPAGPRQPDFPESVLIPKNN
jgi:hypothetical protein